MIPIILEGIDELQEKPVIWGLENKYMGKTWWDNNQNVVFSFVTFPWRAKDSYYDMYQNFVYSNERSMSRLVLFQRKVFPYNIYRHY